MSESEKITINMNVVELGKVDLLVDQGFYSNRTDFIRTAIRNLLGTHADVIQETVTRKAYVIGILVYNRKALEAAKAAGKMLEIKVIGMAYISDDVSPELARATIQSLDVNGGIRAPKDVLEALADRMGKAGGFFQRAS
jgi:Arc/MetJ-type ribon-helix-helix transcriptional regulator